MSNDTMPGTTGTAEPCPTHREDLAGFWTDIECRFAGLPGIYSIACDEDLAQLADDKVGFAAALAGLSRAEYLRRLAGGTGQC